MSELRDVFLDALEDFFRSGEYPILGRFLYPMVILQQCSL